MEFHHLTPPVLLAFLMYSVIISISMSLDTITATQPLRYGDTLVSSGGYFELGFFSPDDSDKKYLGIRYKKISANTIVWVANREAPVVSSAAVGSSLRLAEGSVLELTNASNHIIWASNSSRARQNAVAELLDTGNLVIRNKDEPDSFLWQSFDYPCNIQLSGMKLGKDLITGLDRYLTSWKSSSDPSIGSYTYRLDYRGYPQPVLMKGQIEQYRNAPWNGVGFSGNPNLKPNPVFTYNFVMSNTEIYYIYELKNRSVLSHRYLSPDGTMQRLIWSDQTQSWQRYTTAQSDSLCDTYGLCGKFSSCSDVNFPDCQCLKGFLPKLPNEWNSKNWSSGCVRKKPLNCNGGDGFIRYRNMKLPDAKFSWYNIRMSLDECRAKCLSNCSCVAYASLDISRGGSGCLIWIGGLIDLRTFEENVQDLYVRVNASELGKAKRKIRIIASLGVVAAALLFVSIAVLGWHKRRSTKKGGQEIAVKRLSKESWQGLDEFKNEVICIVKLQHRNLVKLLGGCIKEEEHMLVYEYMPNKSLDLFIFDGTRSKLLEWPKRYQIIKGIARGLIYLHHDSRLRIVHRDLKASNILLDLEMNPKISDFGMARCFDGNNSEAKTKRVVGTYGYMSPEYAIDGFFSTKSDIFSYGVLVLEIISGKRNRGFHHSDHHNNLLGHAWRLYNEGAALELIDPSLGELRNASEMLRSIHVALLCVQLNPDDRPDMPSIGVMLDSFGELPKPKKPGFFMERKLVDKDSTSTQSQSCCTNNGISITAISGR